MLNEIRIGSKITALLLSVVLLAALAISWISYSRGKDAIEQQYQDNLHVIANLKSYQLESMFAEIENNLNIIANGQTINTALELIALAPQYAKDSLIQATQQAIDPFVKPIDKSYRYPNIMLLDSDGNVVYKAKHDGKASTQKKAQYEEHLNKVNIDIYYSEPFRTQDSRFHLYAIAPIFSAQNRTLGYVLIEYDMQEIYQVLNDSTGLRKTGEIVLGKLTNTTTFKFLNSPRNADFEPLSQRNYIGDTRAEALQEAVKGKSGSGLKIDYKGNLTFASWRSIQPVGWGMVVKIDKNELSENLNSLLIVFIIAGLLIIAISFAVSSTFSRLLTEPLLRLKSALEVVARGEIPKRVTKETNDEIGQMAVAVDNLIQSLKSMADFAYRIGDGDFEAEYELRSDNDMLGNALITMRDSIQEADVKEKERTWIVTGVAEIGQILRNNNSIEKLGDELLSFITEKIEAVQGAFYVVNEQEELEHEEPTIDMIASYAYNRKKYLRTSFRFAEGLIGQSAIEKDTILRTEIPDDYVTITSGILGDRKPTCLLIVPLITDDKVFGVMEFAAFEKFNDSKVNFVQETSVIIARTISNIKVNERTIKLLQESQQMSEELQLQQEVLRQNAEEMEATQEELQRTNSRLEEQILEVNRTQKRMQVLLENASEVITIYEKDGVVRYISPSIEAILGYAQSELIGIKDVINMSDVSRVEFLAMFDRLLDNPDETITVQVEYKKKDNETVWLEATGVNRFSDPAVEGIVVNSRDITERRRAEKEARMRGQMQALSENSPDLIMRINTQGKIFYINPTIRNLTGLRVDQFLNRGLNETGLQISVIERWEEVLSDVIRKGVKVIKEMEFPAITGVRVMQLSAIPEYNDVSELESILFVSHDITERKKTEVEIRETNKKISESINYARRIQSAILPNSSFLRQRFPDSFIFYKPRDVVSGDFPWYLEKGDNIYLAAVDCTGHGVPGALISLIGYFLLNDIVNAEEDASPSRILEQLNQDVTRTLKQDKDAQTKDGMDIALCKINLKEQRLEYAGAHRPLYMLHKNTGELKQYKGDRAPVGGSLHYKAQDSFTSYSIDINKGDSVYLFSDGLPDQFGGPENRKFGPQRMRSLIKKHKDEDMQGMHKAFEDSFYNWQGNYKQIDDILLIGIKF
ncbi:MAG: PAS domain S-box protein [Bernardetiaceae bacterium]|nr:PAS domain S-box protein [Bernardetiaceae bacterium]